MVIAVWLLLLFQVHKLSFALRIKNLLGAPPVTFEHHSGYYQVAAGRYLHYWFIESQNHPANDSVVLWLTGGPGCSGFSAAFTEVGPFTINNDGRTLSLNPYSWNRNANLLIVESPAGVGFSYSEHKNFTTDDAITALENFEFLNAFFEEYTHLQNNDFYVIGESYAGIYVPTLVDVITQKQERSKINLKGMAIGNGCVSQKIEMDTIIPFVYYHGLIDETKWNQVKKVCCNNSIDDCKFHAMKRNDFCGHFVEETIMKQWLAGINPYGMYTDCAEDSKFRIQTRYNVDRYQKLSLFLNSTSVPRASSSLPCIDEFPLTFYMNLQQVREAFAVPQHLPSWSYCNMDVLFNYKKIHKEMKSRIQDAVEKGIRVWLYYGDTDMACNFLMGQKFAHQLGYKVTSEKNLYIVGSQVAGSYTQYGNVTFLTIRGAGHMVPTDKPEVAYHLLEAFLQNRTP